MQPVTQNYLSLFNVQPRKGDLKKIEIIKAAIHCISSIGYEKTSYQAIADQIDINRAHVAYHFNDKSDIFKACVDYIISNYQTVLLDHIDNATSEEETLIFYAESPFIWAEVYPKELSVMLLFYYLCTIDKEYRNLNDRIRKDGIQRILLVLIRINRIKNNINDLELLATKIQNLISGTLVDIATTNKESLLQGKINIRKNITQMISEMEKK